MTSEAPGQRQRARDHALPPHPRQGHRAVPRQRQIGTTGRGIGPTYADKINRVGIRIQDLFDEDILRQKVEGALHDKNQLLVKVYNRRGDRRQEIADDYLAYAERLRPFVADTGLLLNKALDDGKTVLLEGGQATMLDVDHGTYPFVTSSNPTAGGACDGVGHRADPDQQVIGIVKAYTTRVGSGPFPTELKDESGECLRKKGFEFGVTTGRPRRTRLVRRGDRALRDAGQRHHRLRHDQARRAHRPRRDPGLRRLRGRRHARRRDPGDADRLPPRDADLRVPRRLEGGHLRGPSFEDLPRRRRTTCGRSRSCPARRSARSASGPRRDQTFSLRPLL